MGDFPTKKIRQPPPPRSRSENRDAEQGDAVVVGGNGESVNRNSRRPYYFRRCKRIRSTSNIESLSGDLLFQILVHLPAQDLYDWVRLVCWKWNRMIHTHTLIYENLHSSPSGLVIHSLLAKSRPLFVSMRQGQIEMSNFNNYEFKSRVYSSCNGLMVGYSTSDWKTIHIFNPVTNQNFQVPPFLDSVQMWAVCIAYSPVSMEYKVVISHNCNLEYGYEPYIFTLGVDESWRRMNTQHLSPEARKFFRSRPLVTEGFIHFAKLSYHVVTINVETEILTETPVPLPPKVGGGEKRYTFYMSSGNDRLSLFIACGGFSWDVWEMKPETGEWRSCITLMWKLKRASFDSWAMNMWNPSGQLNGYTIRRHFSFLLLGLTRKNQKGVNQIYTTISPCTISVHVISRYFKYTSTFLIVCLYLTGIAWYGWPEANRLIIYIYSLLSSIVQASK